MSIAVADAFLAALRRSDPSVVVDTLNVWDEGLPDFDSRAIGAKYKGVSHEPMDEDERATWDRIQSLARRFREADRVVLGVPMWNFAYPYKLKQLIDLACQRNLLFTFDGKAYGPMLEIPKALLICVRGQSDEAGSAGFEHQVNYLKFWLEFIGVRDVTTLTVEHTWDDKARESVELGKQRAAALAAGF